MTEIPYGRLRATETAFGGRAGLEGNRALLRSYGPTHYPDGVVTPLVAGDEALLTRFAKGNANNDDVAEAFARYGLQAVSPIARDDVWAAFLNGRVDTGAGDTVLMILGALPGGPGSFVSQTSTAGLAASDYQPQFGLYLAMDAPDGCALAFMVCAAAFDLATNTVTGPPNEPGAATARDLWTKFLVF